MHGVIGLSIILLLSSCAFGGSLSGADMPRGQAAYAAFTPAASVAERDQNYRIGPSDTLAVTVFQEPELSTTPDVPLQVDTSGNVTLPLIGSVLAAGKTTGELGALIAERLAVSYLKNPQVNVVVASSSSQRVSVQGEVTQPGVYDMKGKTSLLEALSMARGETRVAAINEVAVFRQVEGQRMAALFDVQAIRRGQAPDPELKGNDIVIVGFSRSKQLWQDVLSSTPILGIFRAF